MLPADGEISFKSPLVVWEKRLLSGADEPLKLNTTVKDEAGSDCNGALSVTISRVVVGMDRVAIEDSRTPLDISGNPEVLDSPLLVTSVLPISLSAVDEGRKDITILVSTLLLTISEVARLEAPRVSVPIPIPVVDVSIV